MARSNRAPVDLHMSSQHAIITRTEARALGVSDSAIARRLASGEWERIHPRVFRAAVAPVTPEQLGLAAVKWAGAGSAVSHRSALLLWGYEGAPGVLEI